MGFKIRRKATATWAGSDTAGGGHIALGSGSFEGPYSLKSRVEGVPQVNPEELLGAALAACFTMSVSNKLTDAGYEVGNLETRAEVLMAEDGGRYSITNAHLIISGSMKDIGTEEFERIAQEAKASCPVSRALSGTSVTLAVEALVGS
ncbi:OsmC family peroxiredoxin [Arthrobacter sp. HMWF013]|uniref:OsmC family peroxiredoxin n=1 Tax=Arthrobacter sp. HMWF013 TaxID=2056849 RepID=UPI0011B24636|nr:OsmC family peroxiredoxin [Arthrobacter sp. HMWF013]